MDKAEEILKKTGEWLNTQGYDIDLKDHFWMEDCRFSEHKVRDISELLNDFASLKVKEKIIEAINDLEERKFEGIDPDYIYGLETAIEILNSKING